MKSIAEVFDKLGKTETIKVKIPSRKDKLKSYMENYPNEGFYVYIDDSLDNVKIGTARFSGIVHVKKHGVIPSNSEDGDSKTVQYSPLFADVAPFNCCIGDYTKDVINYVVIDWYKPYEFICINNKDKLGEILPKHLNKLVHHENSVCGLFDDVKKMRKEIKNHCKSRVKYEFNSYKALLRKSEKIINKASEFHS